MSLYLFIIGIGFILCSYIFYGYFKIHNKFKKLLLIYSHIEENFTLSWMSLLQGFVDTEGYNIIDSYAQQTKAAIDAGKYELATDLWGRTEMIILQVTGGIDFYNVLFPVHSSSKSRPITSFRGKRFSFISYSY